MLAINDLVEVTINDTNNSKFKGRIVREEKDYGHLGLSGYYLDDNGQEIGEPTDLKLQSHQYRDLKKLS